MQEGSTFGQNSSQPAGISDHMNTLPSVQEDWSRIQCHKVVTVATLQYHRRQSCCYEVVTPALLQDTVLLFHNCSNTILILSNTALLPLLRDPLQSCKHATTGGSTIEYHIWRERQAFHLIFLEVRLTPCTHRWQASQASWTATTHVSAVVKQR